jgi:sporulation protein YlmC with PRC-barrel domain
MDLARDLLDTRVVDRHGRDMGRVDEVILDVDERGMLRVAAIELGTATLGRRIAPFLGRWLSGLERALGIDEGRPMRIPFDAILDITDNVKVDFAFGETPAATVEKRVRRVLSSIPGA